MLNTLDDLARWVIEAGYDLNDLCGFWMLWSPDRQPCGVKPTEPLMAELRQRGFIVRCGGIDDREVLSCECIRELKKITAKKWLAP